jgi:hypothetical protein
VARAFFLEVHEAELSASREQEQSAEVTTGNPSPSKGRITGRNWETNRMLYNPSTSSGAIPPVTRLFVPVNDNGADVVTITGRALSRSLCGKTPAQRAALAALAMDSDLTIVNPTVGQITRIYEISAPTLNKARDLWPDVRLRVAAGMRPLVTAQDRMMKVAGEIRSVADAMRIIIEAGPELFLDALDVITAPQANAAE